MVLFIYPFIYSFSGCSTDFCLYFMQLRTVVVSNFLGEDKNIGYEVLLCDVDVNCISI